MTAAKRDGEGTRDKLPDLPRLLVAENLSADAVFQATDEQANYLLRVLRKRDGDEILVFNGRDGEWLVRLENASKRACALRAVSQTRGQSQASDLVCLFAPLKKARLDYVVQKAVEMGAGVLQPVITQRTQVDRVKLDRMVANVREAAEQCGVLSVPEVREPQALKTVLNGWDSARKLVFADERAEVGSPVDVLATLAGHKLALLIGPEGGFSSDEQAFISDLAFAVPVSLGPRVMRADTALVAGLAVVQAVAGDWRA